MAAINVPLSEDLHSQIERMAREQKRDTSEILAEAVKRYIAGKRLEQLARRGEARMRAMGIKEEDVPGLIEEYRRENQSRER